MAAMLRARSSCAQFKCPFDFHPSSNNNNKNNNNNNTNNHDRNSNNNNRNNKNNRNNTGNNTNDNINNNTCKGCFRSLRSDLGVGLHGMYHLLARIKVKEFASLWLARKERILVVPT